MEARRVTRRRLSHLRGLAWTLLVGGATLAWGVATHGPWLLYPLAGLVIGALVVASNADWLLEGDGWRGALLLLLCIALWLPLSLAIFATVVADQFEAARERPPA